MGAILLLFRTLLPEEMLYLLFFNNCHDKEKQIHRLKIMFELYDAQEQFLKYENIQICLSIRQGYCFRSQSYYGAFRIRQNVN